MAELPALVRLPAELGLRLVPRAKILTFAQPEHRFRRLLAIGKGGCGTSRDVGEQSQYS